jgi:phenylpropionate dioxygenase-like ring-hydroxylating dioxygenase large terminal subunit
MSDTALHLPLSDQIEQEKLKPGFTLSQPFYTDPGIFQNDLPAIFSRQWLLVDHESRIEKKGQYFLFNIGQESIIIIRENKSAVNVFYNVCRHRGSRLCLEAQGKENALVCPYHAWTYGLDGKLKMARTMPADFEPIEYPLKRCHVRVYQGLIFINLSLDNPPDFDLLYQNFSPFLAQQGTGKAKIAVRRTYPNQANWKLVVENFIECYHCTPAHPEYCSVHSEDKLLAFGAGSGPEEAVNRYQQTQKQ